RMNVRCLEIRISLRRLVKVLKSCSTVGGSTTGLATKAVPGASAPISVTTTGVPIWNWLVKPDGARTIWQLPPWLAGPARTSTKRIEFAANVLIAPLGVGFGVWML